MNKTVTEQIPQEKKRHPKTRFYTDSFDKGSEGGVIFDFVDEGELISNVRGENLSIRNISNISSNPHQSSIAEGEELQVLNTEKGIDKSDELQVADEFLPEERKNSGESFVSSKLQSHLSYSRSILDVMRDSSMLSERMSQSIEDSRVEADFERKAKGYLRKIEKNDIKLNNLEMEKNNVIDRKRRIELENNELRIRIMDEKKESDFLKHLLNYLIQEY